MNQQRILSGFVLLAALGLFGCSVDNAITGGSTRVITALGGTFHFEDSAFVLVAPAQAVSNPTSVTVRPGSDYPLVAGILPGTVFGVTESPPATWSTFNVTMVRLRYPEPVAGDPAAYRIYRVSGSSWTPLTTQSVNTDARYVEARFAGPGTYAILAGSFSAP